MRILIPAVETFNQNLLQYLRRGHYPCQGQSDPLHQQNSQCIGDWTVGLSDESLQLRDECSAIYQWAECQVIGTSLTIHMTSYDNTMSCEKKTILLCFGWEIMKSPEGGSQEYGEYIGSIKVH